MATRLLLALLALLTGLTAPVSAAQARVRASAEAGIEAVEMAGGAVAVAARVAAIDEIPLCSAVPVAEFGGAPALYPVVLAPAVRTGIDRAHE